MKLAITVWNGRIAPLFDVAHHVLIVETEGFGNPILQLTTIEMHAELPRQKVETLVAMDVQAVVCGAISREYEEAVLQAGMELDAFVAGDVDDVLAAWRSGTMRQQGYSMPGCPCPLHRRMHRGMGVRHGYGRHRLDR